MSPDMTAKVKNASAGLLAQSWSGFCPVAAVLVVPCLPVRFESLDATVTLRLIKPAELEDVPGCLNLVNLGEFRSHGKGDAVDFRLLLPGLAGA